MMSAALASLPMYQQPQQLDQSQMSTFNGTITQPALPKLLTYAPTPQGNVFLYEVKKTTILLSGPESLDIPGYKKTAEQFATPDGNRSGYVFYKNRPDHIKKLDELFGEGWKTQLSEPLPPPAESKNPNLLWSGFINNGTVSFYLYEYSNVSMVAFTPAQLDESQGVKAWRSLECPHAPPNPSKWPDLPYGKADGYIINKSPGRQHAYLRALIGDVDYESKYIKSTPPVRAVVSKQALSTVKEVEPLKIFFQTFFNSTSGTSTEVELFEYRETSLVLFLTPHVDIPGFTLTQGLTHPTQGKRQGFSISKNYAPAINQLKTMFGITNLEDLYTMKPNAAGSEYTSAGLNKSATTMANGLSSMSTTSFNDLPIETLARLLMQKLTEVPTLETKELISKDTLYYGPDTEVDASVELQDTMQILLEVSTNGKKLVILTNASD